MFRFSAAGSWGFNGTLMGPDGAAGGVGARKGVEKWNRMDPSRKRAIRLVVALTAALRLASALIYVSFSSGREEVTASQLLRVARPGQAYILAGTVLRGSVRHQGEALLFRIRDPRRDLSVPVRYTGEV